MTVLPDFYNNLGEISFKLQDYDAAIEHYNKGLEIAEDAGNFVGAGYMLVNLGSIYIELNDFERANLYLSKAYQLYEKIPHNEGLIMLIGHMLRLRKKRVITKRQLNIILMDIRIWRMSDQNTWDPFLY